MQKRLVKLNEELKPKVLAESSVGIGLHTGVATVGYIGSDQRSEYTAIGDTVNTASRLESNALGGTDSDKRSNRERLRRDLFTLIPQEPLNVKNRLQPVSLFEVKWN